ncbi:MAG TPA: response regulator transcription factor [Chloroflexota bacterium]|nr:response regulator transcription factor [Chloroflexota bacterium]
MSPMKALLVDDHALFLEGLQNLLLARGLDVVGTANDGLEALARARELHPDVVLMDIQMPRCNGLEATRLIKAEMPDVKIVMLTMSAEDEDLFQAIKAGASGYLLKNLDAGDFFDLLSGLEHGEAPLSKGLAARILDEFARQAGKSPSPSRGLGDEPLDELTPRQMEVLTLVAQGMTYKEIGATLCLTERTVKYHMGQILEKLHVKKRAQAIAYARNSHMISGNRSASE